MKEPSRFIKFLGGKDSLFALVLLLLIGIIIYVYDKISFVFYPIVIIFSTIGSIIGAIVLFGIGRLLDVDKLEKIVNRWGHILRLTQKDVQKADAWFRKIGVWAVLIGRLVPIVRSLISIPAGMARMNFGIFLFFTMIGSLIWNSVLVTIGAKLGSSWNTILEYVDIYSNVVLILLAILFLMLIIWFIKTRK